MRLGSGLDPINYPNGSYLEPKTKTEPELRIPNHNIFLSKIFKIIRIIQVFIQKSKKTDIQSE